MTGKVSDAAHAAREQVEDRGAEIINQAKQKASEVYDQANKRLSEQYEKAIDYGRENPGNRTDLNNAWSANHRAPVAGTLAAAVRLLALQAFICS